MRFTPSFLDEIRDRVPISSVIGQRVSWDRRKTNAGRGDFWACCPFHGEKSPSFHCEDRKGRYHCFGCGASGDHFRFLVELDGVSFPEAVEKIADMAGIALPARDADAEKREKERASLHDVMELAAGFFEAQLQAPAGARARAYLRERGLSPATQQRFRLGYAPDSRNALKEFLAGKGIDKAQIEACGLVRHGEDIPVSYDWFRDRIMFPIADPRGRVIAFGGRALAADALAKYMNSPDTELFHKGNVLYNLGPARQAAQKAGTVVAVEGYMDVIALAQAGFDNIVAPLGTALTEPQLELLWRISGEPVLCFDGDQAGLKAAWRAADLALPLIAAGRTVRFALLGEGKDPDDLVRSEGPGAFAALLAEARPLAEMIWTRETAGGVFETPERRAELEKRLREITARIRDESVRYHYQQDMRERVLAFFGAGRGANRGDSRRFERGRPDAKGRPGGISPRMLPVSEGLARSALARRAGNGMAMREAALIVALASHPALAEEWFDTVEKLDFDHEGMRAIHSVLMDAAAHHYMQEPDRIAAALDDAGLSPVWERAMALVKGARLWSALPGAAIEDAREAFGQALHLQLSARTLHKELKAAETALAGELTEENHRRLVDIQAQLRAMQAAEALIDGFGILSGRAGKA